MLVPPDVNEPGKHTEQSDALFTLHRLSAPHSTQPPLAERCVPARQNAHCVAPASDVSPASHAMHSEAPAAEEYEPAAQGSTTLVPSHAEPAGHRLQLVRVVLVPPEVNQPTVQTSQLVA